jgi:hypothetical protein
MNKYIHCIYLDPCYRVARVILASDINEAYSVAKEPDELYMTMEDGDLLVEVEPDQDTVTDTYKLIDGILCVTFEPHIFYPRPKTVELYRSILDDPHEGYSDDMIGQATLYVSILNLAGKEPINDTYPIDWSVIGVEPSIEPDYTDEVSIERLEYREHYLNKED